MDPSTLSPHSGMVCTAIIMDATNSTFARTNVILSKPQDHPEHGRYIFGTPSETKIFLPQQRVRNMTRSYCNLSRSLILIYPGTQDITCPTDEVHNEDSSPVPEVILTLFTGPCRYRQSR